MRIDVSLDIPFPSATVFAAYRDNLVDLVPYLPNIRGIAVTSKEQDGAVTRMLNRWKGGGEIPLAVRKFLSEDLIEWDDHASWNQDAWTCDWRTVVPAFKDAVDAKGQNHFTEKGPNVTHMAIRGELKVDAGKVKGVPRLLSGTVSPMIEAFLVNAIKPNFSSVAKGLEQYLKSKPA